MADKQAVAVTEEMTGPPEKVAYDIDRKPDQWPSPEIRGKGQGVCAVKSLITVKETAQGQAIFSSASKTRKGLAGRRRFWPRYMLPQVVKGHPLSQDHALGRPGHGLHFVRPGPLDRGPCWESRWCSFDPGRDIKSRTASPRGHRFMAPVPVKDQAGQARGVSRTSFATPHVVAGPGGKKEPGTSRKPTSAAKGRGFSKVTAYAVLPDPELVEEVANLIEYARAHASERSRTNTSSFPPRS